MLLRQPLREADATRTFYVLTGVVAFCLALCFTLNLVFQFRVIGLDPFQMVLVGTTLELTCFLFEVPTGIVADLYSRRLSVIIGFALIGVGFTVEGIVATFAAALVGNVVWGIGYTFTSGALQAWITDEVGEGRMGRVFTRETQIDLAFTIVGTLAAGALGLVSLRTPVVAAGAGLLLLAVGLLFVMPERNFAPTPRGDRESFAADARPVRRGARRGPRAAASCASSCSSASSSGCRARRSTGSGGCASSRTSRCRRSSVATRLLPSPSSPSSAPRCRCSPHWPGAAGSRPRSSPSTRGCPSPSPRCSRSGPSSGWPCSATCGSRSPRSGCGAPRWPSAGPSRPPGSTATSTRARAPRCCR